MPAVPAEWFAAGASQFLAIHRRPPQRHPHRRRRRLRQRCIQAKGWDELGYHFVIGNGTDTNDGQSKSAPAGPSRNGAPTPKPPTTASTSIGIGICLVGNFDVSHPSDAQMKSLGKLVAYLMKTYHIPADHVLGHGDCKSTDCPGKYISIAKVRQISTNLLADAGDAIPPDAKPQLASGEMMHEVAGTK